MKTSLSALSKIVTLSFPAFIPLSCFLFHHLFSLTFLSGSSFVFPLECRFYEGRVLCVYCSLVCCQHLQQCLAHSSNTINIYWANEWLIECKECWASTSHNRNTIYHKYKLNVDQILICLSNHIPLLIHFMLTINHNSQLFVIRSPAKPGVPCCAFTELFLNSHTWPFINFLLLF